MAQSLRRDVLRAFKRLHCARKKVFQDDDRALKAAREKINEEFRKNKNVADSTSIQEMINFANAVEHELRTAVIQAVEVAPGKFEARITKDTAMLDNAEFGVPTGTGKGQSPCSANLKRCS